MEKVWIALALGLLLIVRFDLHNGRNPPGWATEAFVVAAVGLIFYHLWRKLIVRRDAGKSG